MRKVLFLSLTLLTVFAVCGVSDAGIEWRQISQTNIAASPIDSVVSTDGKWAFFLLGESVLVYSTEKNEVERKIVLDSYYDTIDFDHQNQRLLLSSKKKKSVKILQLENVYELDYTGRYLKGPETARVTVAVFSDYQ